MMLATRLTSGATALLAFVLVGFAGSTNGQTTQRDRRLVRVNELAARPDGAAAEKAYRAALEQFVPMMETLRRMAEQDAKFDLLGDWDERYLVLLKPRNDDDCKLARAWRTDNTKTVQSIIEATTHPSASFRFDSRTGRLSDVDQAVGIKFLHLGRFSLVLAAEALRSGDASGAYAWNERALRIADHLYQQPFMLLRNAGWLLERECLTQLAQFLERVAPPDSNALCRRLASQGRDACKSEAVAELERLFSEDWYAKFLDWAADRKKYPEMEEEIESLRTIGEILVDKTKPRFASLDELRNAIRQTNLKSAMEVRNRYYDELSAWYALPLHRALPDARAVAKRLAAIAKQDPLVDFTCGLDADIGRDISTDRRLWGWTVSMRRASAGMVALWHVRRSKGAFPPRLGSAALEFGNLNVTDEFVGEPLKYQVAGDSFRLYSVGVNQKDDGGKTGDEKAISPDDLVFWPIEAESGD